METESAVLTKSCTKCDTTKPVSDFHVHKRGRFGVRSDCKECSRAYHRDRSRTLHAFPLYGLGRQLKSRYGLTIKEYETLLDAQGGVCCICKRTCSVEERLSVDHDHVSGHIRGLLCHSCNVGLGKFRDDPSLLTAAIAYLEKHRN